METKSVVPRNFDDLVFENRNKDYGAYVIRRSYDDNVNKAFFLTVLAGIFLAVSVFAVSSIDFGHKIVSKPIINVISCGFDKLKIEINKPLKQSKPPVKTRTEKLVPMVTKDLVPDVEIITPNEDVSNTATTGSGADNITPSDGNNVSDGNQIATVPFEKKKAIFLIVEKMPAFPGGEEALAKFLRRNLKYPRRAAENEIQGNVFVSFVIDTDGKVISAEIIKGISRECDREAERVILAMPDWEPGIQNKTPVMVKMVLPIKFRLES